MKIAIVGLGKMGTQIVEALAQHDHTVFTMARNQAESDLSLKLGAQPLQHRPEIITQFASEPVVVWLMIPASKVDQEITEWLEILPAHSLLIDGGNTDFRLTITHAQRAQAKQVNFIDIGVSGGIMGRQNGFSMMVGGQASDCQAAIPALNTLAAPKGGFAFFGQAGSGHYVKMVHNAIEYGMMESLAEGYRMLKEGPFANLDLAKAGQVWQQSSVIESTLNRLAHEIMIEDQTLARIEGLVAESGEARWTLEVAKEMNIDLPAIQSSFDVRLASQKGVITYTTKLLAALRNKFGGHTINPVDTSH